MVRDRRGQKRDLGVEVRLSDWSGIGRGDASGRKQVLDVPRHHTERHRPSSETQCCPAPRKFPQRCHQAVNVPVDLWLAAHKTVSPHSGKSKERSARVDDQHSRRSSLRDVPGQRHSQVGKRGTLDRCLIRRQAAEVHNGPVSGLVRIDRCHTTHYTSGSDQDVPPQRAEGAIRGGHIEIHPGGHAEADQKAARRVGRRGKRRWHECPRLEPAPTQRQARRRLGDHGHRKLPDNVPDRRQRCIQSRFRGLPLR